MHCNNLETISAHHTILHAMYSIAAELNRRFITVQYCLE